MKFSIRRSEAVWWIIVIMALAMVLAAGIYVNLILRTMERTIPVSLLDQLEDLSQITEGLRELTLDTAKIRNSPSQESVSDLIIRIDSVFTELIDLRNTYVYDNLVQASAFHSVVAPSLVDAREWLINGISGHAPDSMLVLTVVHSRLSDTLANALSMRRQSHAAARDILKDQRKRLERFIKAVNLLLLLALIVSWMVLGLMIRQQRLLTREIDARSQNEKLQAQLFQAQKMESIGIMAGGIAHDFNNLLHAMGGNLELLNMKLPEDHPGKKRVRSIQKSMDRAALLVRQMLQFSRKAEAKRQNMDLNQEIQHAAEMLERTIPKMVSIELDLDKEARFINADPIQVEQVLLNLGGNAADSMPDGGRLIIETINVDVDEPLANEHTGLKKGGYVLLRVSDTGCGMDNDSLDKIFDPFFTTKEMGKGTGLGLASAYGIIKAHEGHISCYSEVGQGTTFNIYLPAAKQEQTDHAEAEPQEPDSLEGTETILIVDDDDQIRDLARELLEDSGYQVLSAASGEQALEIFKEHTKKIDLVVMDLNMPGMGGRKCTTEMLSIDPSVKVLVASGYSAVGHGRGALKFGAKDFISKPYQMREILAKVREVLDGDKR